MLTFASVFSAYCAVYFQKKFKKQESIEEMTQPNYFLAVDLPMAQDIMASRTIKNISLKQMLCTNCTSMNLKQHVVVCDFLKKF